MFIARRATIAEPKLERISIDNLPIDRACQIPFWIMADGQREGEGNSNYFEKKSNKKGSESDETGEDSEEASLQLDIGLGEAAALNRSSTSECSAMAGACGSDPSLRREDNPFSFKHFLSRGSSVGGARPKVYPTPTPPPSPAPRLMSNPEMTSGLPDFVQDHLVIEQCYLNSPAPPHLAVDLENIPPPGSPENDFVIGDIPFDLTRRERCSDIPLDLPSRMPFDLPRGREPAQPGEVGSSKSLPDFLSDGPIRSERRLDQMPSEPASPSIPQPDPRHSPNHRLHIENERLRREVDSLRRMVSDQISRNETLESELCVLRNRDQSDSAALEKVIEQVEDNLKRTTRRAITAESQVSKLKEEIRTLTNQLNSVTGGGARSREGAAASSSSQQTDNERLASQLRNAANNAELSLRHLLLGVDNLRQLASSLEPQTVRHRLSSNSEDSQDENEPGPAL